MVTTQKILKQIFFFILVLSMSTQIAFAVAPSDEVKAKWKEQGIYQDMMDLLNDFHARGGCAPEENLLKKSKNSLATAAEVDTVRVIVLMVDFSDHPADGQALFGTTTADFDSILFSSDYHNPTGSMTDFYLENSYGNFYIVGDVKGWYRMPQTYAYYTDHKSGFGTYPTNAQRLTEDAVMMADPDVDFSLYDFNNDAVCDGVILIHSGPGAEILDSATALDNIWSHKWNLISNRNLDGVIVSAYNINPEEFGVGGMAELSPIGVFCHEYGHFLGLPDLYDTNNNNINSNGLGRWSLMATGNYSGNSKSPSHFDAWSKDQIGFLTLTQPTDNLYNVSIPQVESEPVAYKLRNQFMDPNEYFVVENRQKVGFDSFLPYHGLLIYHVDDNIATNTNPLHYKVALEQADNLNQLAMSGSTGDGGDPFPGTTSNRNFQRFTFPNSNTYLGAPSEVGVWNISNSDSLMTADLDISYSRPWIETFGVDPFTVADADNDGILEPGETVELFFSIRNLMRHTQNVHATLTSDNLGLQYTKNDITVSSPFSAVTLTNPANPLEFVIPDTISPHIDSFFLEITTDSLNASLNPIAGSVTHTKTFGFEFTLGTPNILIVDADRGDTLELTMNNSLYTKRVPSDIWDINSSGTPTIGYLMNYDMVLWHTGQDVASGAISAADITVMKQYMDNGMNLMLTTVQGIDDIMNIDSTLLIDYFNARPDGGTIQYPGYIGVAGNPVGDGLSLLPTASNPFALYNISTLIPTGSGLPAFTSGGQVCGVTHDGAFKSVLLTFAADLLDNYEPSINNQADLIDKVVDFFGGVSTAIYDGSPYASLPSSFDLFQNYPNPFNPITTIQYTVRATEEIGAVTQLEVFNMMGQKVVTLVDEAQIPGNYQVQWDGTNTSHQEVSSGIYFYRLVRGTESSTKKMTLLK